MRYLCLSFFILIFLGCQPKELPTQTKVDSEESYLKISHMTTIDELKKAQLDLMQVGIAVDFHNSIFFDNGKIRILDLVVVLPDGTGGSCKADLVKLQFKYYGFQYSTTKPQKLKTGALD